MIEFYVKDSAQEQLEENGREKWWTPLKFYKEPQKGYTCKIYVTEEENEYDCVEFDEDLPFHDGVFYPDRHEELFDILERITFVELKEPEKKASVRKDIKVGQDITMYFDCFGITSEELVTIMEFDDKEIVVEDIWHTDAGPEENGRFCRDTGKCLNDNTGFGGRRRIDPM